MSDRLIYSIHNLTNGKIYVGQTCAWIKRRSAHLVALRGGTHHNEHLQSAFNRDGENAFEFAILESVVAGATDAREVAWIAFLRADDRAFGYNKNAGGQGERVVTPETREKMRVNQTGRKFGPRSEETKQRQRDAWQLRKARGWTFSTESRAKISAKGIGRKASDETRSRMSVSQNNLAPEVKQRRRAALLNVITGRPVSEETRRKISESNKKTGRTPEQKQRAQAARRAVGYHFSEEARARMSKASSGRVVTQETKIRISESQRGKVLSPEHRRKISESRRGWVISPEQRLKMSASHRARYQSLIAA